MSWSFAPKDGRSVLAGDVGEDPATFQWQGGVLCQEGSLSQGFFWISQISTAIAPNREAGNLDGRVTSPIQSVVLRKMIVKSSGSISALTVTYWQFFDHQAELRTQLDEITAKMDELQVWGAGMQGSRFPEVHFFFFLGIVLSVGERWVVSCCSPTWSKSWKFGNSELRVIPGLF